jgi:hypothetical protein
MRPTALWVITGFQPGEKVEATSTILLSEEIFQENHNSDKGRHSSTEGSKHYGMLVSSAQTVDELISSATHFGLCGPWFPVAAVLRFNINLGIFFFFVFESHFYLQAVVIH